MLICRTTDNPKARVQAQRMITPCSFFWFGKVYIIFPLLSIGALIHIFCLSLIHALMDETAIISMHVCSPSLQHWKKKHTFILLPAHLRSTFTPLYLLPRLFSCCFFLFVFFSFFFSYAKKTCFCFCLIPNLL